MPTIVNRKLVPSGNALDAADGNLTKYYLPKINIIFDKALDPAVKVN